MLVGAQVNLALYSGPVKNGTGTIIVLWNYPSLGPPPTLTGPGPSATPAPGVTPLDYQSELLWSDGLRMLQGTVLDITCNVGHYNEQTFSIGGKPGIGAYYNASQCPGTPDTAGWFAGVNQFGVSYLFYVYIDPIDAYNDGRGDIQKMLDAIQFLQPTVAPAPNGPPPTNTPGK